MDTTDRQQIETTLRSNWESLYPEILNRFGAVSKFDIADALDTDDLVARISDRSGFGEQYVEGQLKELCTSGAPSGQQQQRSSEYRDSRVPFGHAHGDTSSPR